MLEKLKQDITVKLSSAEYFQGAELPAVEFSPAPAHTGADVSLNWAMAAAKKLRKNPMEIAKEAIADGGVLSIVQIHRPLNKAALTHLINILKGCAAFTKTC